jgi:hypothetical protein
MAKHMYTQVSPVENHSPTQSKLNGRRMTFPALCYHPAVFFRHLRRVALSLPQGKIQHVFAKFFFFYFLKMRN